MFLVDLNKGRIINDDELKKEICTSQPYQQWLEEKQIKLDELPEPRMRFTRIQGQDVLKFQKLSYSREDIEKSNQSNGRIWQKEPIGSMGFDSQLQF